jgi:hypothetical protein
MWQGARWGACSIWQGDARTGEQESKERKMRMNEECATRGRVRATRPQRCGTRRTSLRHRANHVAGLQSLKKPGTPTEGCAAPVLGLVAVRLLLAWSRPCHARGPGHSRQSLAPGSVHSCLPSARLHLAWSRPRQTRGQGHFRQSRALRKSPAFSSCQTARRPSSGTGITVCVTFNSNAVLSVLRCPYSIFVAVVFLLTVTLSIEFSTCAFIKHLSQFIFRYK